jgi:hypothetical protein
VKCMQLNVKCSFGVLCKLRVLKYIAEHRENKISHQRCCVKEQCREQWKIWEERYSAG